MAFQCRICNKSLSRKDGLRRHHRLIHGLERTERELSVKEKLIQKKRKPHSLKKAMTVALKEDGRLQRAQHYVDLGILSLRNDRTIPLTLPEFMLATGLSIPEKLTDKLWNSYYEHPNEDIYVDDDMVQWIGLAGDLRTQKGNFIRLLETYEIPYDHMTSDQLQEHIRSGKEVMNMPNDDELIEMTKKGSLHIIMQPMTYKEATISSQTEMSKQLRRDLLNLDFLVHVYLRYQREFSDRIARRFSGEVSEMKPKVAVILNRPQKTEELHVVKVDDTHAVIIRGQRGYAGRRMKKIMQAFDLPPLTDTMRGIVYKHPNAVSKWYQLARWLKMGKLIDNVKLKIKGQKFECIRCIGEDFTVDKLIQSVWKQHPDQDTNVEGTISA
jgi:hypothetical protein